jgi:vacuolar-type H+-ATPase subunit I/STV1
VDLKAISMDPFGFVKQAITELPKVKPKLRVVEPLQATEQRMDLLDEREEELKRGLNKYADYLANKNMQAQAKAQAAHVIQLQLEKEKKHSRAYKKIRDLESSRMLRGYHLKSVA